MLRTVSNVLTFTNIYISEYPEIFKRKKKSDWFFIWFFSGISKQNNRLTETCYFCNLNGFVLIKLVKPPSCKILNYFFLLVRWNEQHKLNVIWFFTFLYKPINGPYHLCDIIQLIFLLLRARNLNIKDVEKVLYNEYEKWIREIIRDGFIALRTDQKIFLYTFSIRPYS